MDRVVEPAQPKPIVLIGFMAAGKSLIGGLLAERLGIPFVDTDKVIEDEFGTSIAGIFRDRGEQVFRDAERSLIRRLLVGSERVIAAGGGAFIDPDTRESLNRHAHTVWLDPPFEVIMVRLAGSDVRPLVPGRTEHELRRLWDQRRQSYALAQFRVDASDADPVRIAERIARLLT